MDILKRQIPRYLNGESDFEGLPVLSVFRISSLTDHQDSACRAGSIPAAICYINSSISKIEEYSRHELLKTADAAKILKIGQSKMVQIIPPGENLNIRFGSSVRIRVE